MATRYEYFELLAPKITDELIVTSIGGVDHEWHKIKDREANLYHVTMSASCSVALGLALALPHRRVLCFDGDGSILMGLPVLTDIGRQNPSNLVVMIFDNESYEAPSRQCSTKLETHACASADLVAIARGAGISNAWLVTEPAEFQKAVAEAFKADGASFIQVKAEWGEPTPTSRLDGTENKFRFVRYIERTEKLKLI